MYVAIYQPNIFPYVGYLSIYFKVDLFIYYDEANYSRDSWLLGNRILEQGVVKRINFPVIGRSQNCKIKDMKLDYSDFYVQKFLKRIECNYRKAPYFLDGMAYLYDVFSEPIVDVTSFSARCVDKLQIPLRRPKCMRLSELNILNIKDHSQRMLSIMNQVGATHLINGERGAALYDPIAFSKANKDISFLRPICRPYDQIGVTEFKERLSIIDLIMNVGINNIVDHVQSFELISA